ncbi:unnamed protein product, partial [marine sediment metagenome]
AGTLSGSSLDSEGNPASSPASGLIPCDNFKCPHKPCGLFNTTPTIGKGVSLGGIDLTGMKAEPSLILGILQLNQNERKLQSEDEDRKARQKSDDADKKARLDYLASFGDRFGRVFASVFAGKASGTGSQPGLRAKGAAGTGSKGEEVEQALIECQECG